MNYCCIRRKFAVFAIIKCFNCLRTQCFRIHTHSVSLPKQNHYEVLGVKRNSSAKEIRDAYLKLCKEHHPDKTEGKKSTSKFQAINEAYSVLSQKHKKFKYDSTLTNDGMSVSEAELRRKYDMAYQRQCQIDEQIFARHDYKRPFSIEVLSIILSLFLMFVASFYFAIAIDDGENYRKLAKEEKQMEELFKNDDKTDSK